MEPGILKIKLTADYADLAQDLGSSDGRVERFGVRELDELNQHFAVREISGVFASPALRNDFSWRHRQWGLHLWFELRLESKEDIRDIVMAYRALKDIVAWAEPEYKKQLISAESKHFSAMDETLSRWTPNDPYYGYQWHYHNTGQTGGTVDADIDLPEAWDLETGHPDVVVAVIDQGIQTNHPDLAGNMWINPGETPGNGIDDDSNGYVDDVYGYNFADATGTISAGDHGSHTSGTIAAVTNNSTGVSGIAGGSGSGDGVRLMSCQVFSTYNGGFELASIYAADNGAPISQNSWGYTSEGVYDQSVMDAIDYFNANGGGAVMDGGITIFAAGNDGSSGNWYPACYSGCFAVAATNHEDVRSWYSNYDTWVDVSAPGGETSSASAEGVLSCVTGSNYAYMQGTSMACPHVSGVAALVVSYLHRVGSSITNTDLANLLRDTTDDHYYANPSYTGMLGTGRINAHSALLAADPTLPSCTITAPSNGQVFDLNSTIAVNASATDPDGYLTQVAFYIDDETTPSYTDYSSPYAWNWDTTGVSGGNHAIKAIATDNDGNTAQSTVSVILLAPPDEGFETGDFSSYPWTFGGNANWFVQSGETFSGTYAAQSGAITHNETSSMSVTLNITSAGNISFYQKVSSESGYDYLRFYIDGTLQEEWSGGGTWTYESYPVSTGSHTFSWTYQKDASVASGADCAWVDHIIFPSGDLYASIKVYLEGPYLAGGSMAHELGALLPLLSPYDASHSVDALPDVSPRSIVDWVQVQLRASETGPVLQSQSAFLLDDGTIAGLEGNPVLGFPNDGTSEFFVVIHHRNHLAIMSAAPHGFSGSQASAPLIDLTALDSVYGGNQSGVKEIEAGILAMYAGDADQDEWVLPTDYNDYWRLQTGTRGYKSADFDLDGWVLSNDYNDYWRLNTGKRTRVPY